MQKKKITICACASRQFIDKEQAAEIAATMQSKGFDVTVEADLCKKVMTRSSDMKEIASGVILACHTRVIESHLEWLGIEAGGIVSMRDRSKEDILADLQTIAQTTADELSGLAGFRKQIAEFPVEDGTDAWYPVIDKIRCTECGKCHDFCLFGVYTVEDKKVRVLQPQNCKNNCPACARMCPSQAVIFPKYDKSPINGGTEVEEAFNPNEMDEVYRERLRMRLQERRASVSLLKKDKQ